MRVVKQRHILKNNGIQAHQLFRVDLRHIHAAHGDPPSVDIPEPRRQPGNGGLAAAGWPDQRRDLSLFRRKGHIFQHRFAALIGKPHMVEHDIAVAIGELFAAGLHGAIQNLIHPLDVAVRADDGGEVLQRSLQRIVQAGDHQQKHEEGQNVQFALDQQRCAREGGSGNTQPQDKPGGHHEDGRSQLALDEAALHSADFLFQPGKISASRRCWRAGRASLRCTPERRPRRRPSPPSLCGKAFSARRTPARRWQTPQAAARWRQAPCAS